jgi:hypothetical protein
MIPAGARVHFVKGDDPSDDLNDSEKEDNAEEYGSEEEEDFEAVPEIKIRKLEPEPVMDYPLTKFLSKERSFEPVTSGGQFYISK